MDHIFLDQDGVPTIVEVKRSSDTRTRREVVGQMLDYAANAVVYWPIERIRQMFEETCSTLGAEPSLVIRELLGDSIDGSSEDDNVEKFWDSVEGNFRAKRLRMVFVADAIPLELQRIVEFMNEQMKPADVLAVELRQYVGKGGRTLVPRIFGLTAEAQAQKSIRSVSQVDEATLLASLPTEYSVALQEFFNSCRSAGLTIQWGTVGCSIRTIARNRVAPLSIAWVNPPGRPGWSGLTDVTVGVDHSSLGIVSPHLLWESEVYGSEVAGLPGAKVVSTKGMLAYSFSPEDFTSLHKQIADIVIKFCARLLAPLPDAQS
jgi:hypothetical protein